MDIPNMSAAPAVSPKLINLPILLIVISFAIFSGFWLSRLPFGHNSGTANNQTATSASTEGIKSIEDIKVGQVYGKIQENFKDTATGVIQKGDINGVGTHILVRDGGLSQRASLTSSVLDLDLFVNRKVEIKGETNASNKTGWFLDVGVIRVLE